MSSAPAVCFADYTVREKAQTISRFSSEARTFLEQRGYVEVVAPCIRNATVTDPNIESWKLCGDIGKGAQELAKQAPTATSPLFLHTSSEFFQKTLLAAGVGSHFTLGKVFRNEELGRLHAREFTMCEWYKVGGSLSEVVSEAAELVMNCLSLLPLNTCDKAVTSISFDDAFYEATGFDLRIRQQSDFEAKVDLHRKLGAYARKYFGYHSSFCKYASNEFDLPDFLALVDLIFSLAVQPSLKGITIINRFPFEQAALAQISEEGGYRYAQRSEIYLNSSAGVIELANAYQEMNDPDELQQRFEQDRQVRIANQKRPVEIDQSLIEAARKGIPDCAGIALGFDRLLMSSLGLASLEELDLI